MDNLSINEIAILVKAMNIPAKPTLENLFRLDLYFLRTLIDLMPYFSAVIANKELWLGF
jgi:hypothetical protein